MSELPSPNEGLVFKQVNGHIFFNKPNQTNKDIFIQQTFCVEKDPVKQFFEKVHLRCIIQYLGFLGKTLKLNNKTSVLRVLGPKPSE